MASLHFPFAVYIYMHVYKHEILSIWSRFQVSLDWGTTISLSVRLGEGNKMPYKSYNWQLHSIILL